MMFNMRRFFAGEAKSERVCFSRSIFLSFIILFVCVALLVPGRALCQSATQTAVVDLPPIIFSTVDNPRKIVAINPDGTGRKELTDGVFDAYMPMWSPDGKRIVFCSQAAGSPDSAVYMMDAKTGAVDIVRSLSGSECENMDWSNDGDKVLVSVRKKVEGAAPVYADKVYIMSADGKVFDFFANGGFAVWSRDGSRALLLSAEKATSGKLLTLQINDAASTVFMDGISLYPAAISPIGDRLMAVGWRIPAEKIEGLSGATASVSGLFTLAADGSGKLLNIKAEDEPEPQSITYYCDKGCDWSGDGLRVVSHKFTSAEGHRIILFDSQGAGETVLDNSGQYPDWRK